MKKIIVSAIALIVAVATVHAGDAKCIQQPAIQAMGSAYVAVYGGANVWQEFIGVVPSSLDENRKVGWDVGVKLGYDFAKLDCCSVIPALELDSMYTRFNRSFSGTQGFTAKIYNWSTMLNALAKVDAGCGFMPYAGFGLGWHYISLKARGESESRNGFAWQLLGGVDYALDAHWSVFAEYKWLNFHIHNSNKFAGRSRIDQQLVNLGVRYRF